jgi:hypothetical protein
MLFGVGVGMRQQVLTDSVAKARITKNVYTHVSTKSLQQIKSPFDDL